MAFATYARIWDGTVIGTPQLPRLWPTFANMLEHQITKSAILCASFATRTWAVSVIFRNIIAPVQQVILNSMNLKRTLKLIQAVRYINWHPKWIPTKNSSYWRKPKSQSTINFLTCRCQKLTNILSLNGMAIDKESWTTWESWKRRFIKVRAMSCSFQRGSRFKTRMVMYYFCWMRGYWLQNLTKSL